MHQDHTRVRRGFTPRQVELMGLVARGFPNKEIATHLSISEQAVKEQISVLLLRLKVRNRAALAEVGARVAVVGDVTPSGEWLPFLFRFAPMRIAFLRGPEHIFEALNDAWREAAGERDLVGVSLRDAYPEISPDVLSVVTDAYAAGRARTLAGLRAGWERGGRDEGGAMTVVVQPVPDAGVLIYLLDGSGVER